MNIVNDKLTEIFFKKCYIGFGEVTKEEQDYLDNNYFICVVTDETKNNGYESESKWTQENFEIGKEYTFVDMEVGQSSSSLRLEEFPNKQFNTVCFEIRVKEIENQQDKMNVNPNKLNGENVPKNKWTIRFIYSDGVELSEINSDNRKFFNSMPEAEVNLPEGILLVKQGTIDLSDPDKAKIMSLYSKEEKIERTIIELERSMQLAADRKEYKSADDFKRILNSLKSY